jgi:hypothetical protein
MHKETEFPDVFSARASGTVLLVVTKSHTLKLLAFDEYCRFDTSAFFWRIKRSSLYTPKETKSIKTAIFIES